MTYLNKKKKYRKAGYIRHKLCFHNYKCSTRTPILHFLSCNPTLQLGSVFSQNFQTMFIHDFMTYTTYPSTPTAMRLLSPLSSVKYFGNRWPQLFGELLWICLFIGCHCHMTRSTTMHRRFANVQSCPLVQRGLYYGAVIYVPSLTRLTYWINIRYCRMAIVVLYWELWNLNKRKEFSLVIRWARLGHFFKISVRDD